MDLSAHSQLPVVAIVGKPNVGKSALFNRLIGRRKAIVAEQPGVTRDINYTRVHEEGKDYLLADSAGYVRKGAGIWEITGALNRELIQEAACVVLVCDITGPDRDDFDLAGQVRKSGKPTVLVVNKADNQDRDGQQYDFYRLGMGDPVPVSALHGRNIEYLRRCIREALPTSESAAFREPRSSLREPRKEASPIRVAIVGKPNVGKSSLLNLLLGRERSIVTPSPGTTRDMVVENVLFDRRTIAFVDTAGLRRPGKVRENVEYYSTLRTRDAIKRSTLCVQLIDAREGFTGQDKKIASIIVAERKGLILAANKWDLVEPVAEREYIRDLTADFPHVSFALLTVMSAKTGYNKINLLKYIVSVYTNYYKKVKTSELNDRISGLTLHRTRVTYGIQKKSGPPQFEFFIKHGDPEDENFKKFIGNRIRTHFPFEGVPLDVALRVSS